MADEDERVVVGAPASLGREAAQPVDAFRAKLAVFRNNVDDYIEQIARVMEMASLTAARRQ